MQRCPYLQAEVLPDNLKELFFGERFNKPLQPGVLPANLITLHLGRVSTNPFLASCRITTLARAVPCGSLYLHVFQSGQ